MKTKTRQEAVQEQIDEIMDTFDFDRVHRWMLVEDWTWADGTVPSITELRLEARARLKDAASNRGFASCGGFTAIYREDIDQGYKPWLRLDLYFGYSTINDGTSFTE